MSSREELPQELKAVEAAFASLAPRTDGLNRDRLMYLAGRESVLRPQAGRRILRHRLAWPLATSVMTTAAAVLLVMLLARPEPEVVRQIVYVEVDKSGDDASAAEPDTGDSPATADPDQRQEPAPVRSEPQPQPVEPEPGPWSRLLASVTRVDWAQRHRPSRYSEQVERMLAAGPHARFDYATGPASEEEPSAAPASYRQLMDSLLGPSESETPPLDSLPMNSSPLSQGANS